TYIGQSSSAVNASDSCQEYPGAPPALASAPSRDRNLDIFDKALIGFEQQFSSSRRGSFDQQNRPRRQKLQNKPIIQRKRFSSSDNRLAEIEETSQLGEEDMSRCVSLRAESDCNSFQQYSRQRVSTSSSSGGGGGLGGFGTGLALPRRTHSISSDGWGRSGGSSGYQRQVFRQSFGRLGPDCYCESFKGPERRMKRTSRSEFAEPWRRAHLCVTGGRQQSFYLLHSSGAAAAAGAAAGGGGGAGWLQHHPTSNTETSSAGGAVSGRGGAGGISGRQSSAGGAYFSEGLVIKPGAACVSQPGHAGSSNSSSQHQQHTQHQQHQPAPAAASSWFSTRLHRQRGAGAAALISSETAAAAGSIKVEAASRHENVHSTGFLVQRAVHRSLGRGDGGAASPAGSSGRPSANKRQQQRFQRTAERRLPGAEGAPALQDECTAAGSAEESSVRERFASDLYRGRHGRQSVVGASAATVAPSDSFSQQRFIYGAQSRVARGIGDRPDPLQRHRTKLRAATGTSGGPPFSSIWPRRSRRVQGRTSWRRALSRLELSEGGQRDEETTETKTTKTTTQTVQSGEVQGDVGGGGSCLH
uniref:SH2 domain-containing protein n=1 Tax=Macrostomum lignano TaxID=282301 RepID=A0A1I8F2X4_9PLAT